MKKYLSGFLFFLFIISFMFLIKNDVLSLNQLKIHQEELQKIYTDRPATIISLYFLFYMVITAMSLPGAAVLTLAGGAIFGLGIGLIVVSFASTLGATFAFLASRYFLKDFVQTRFKDNLEKINLGFQREGALYLLTLRLIPVFPFFLVNLVMGLLPLRIAPFFIVSQLGMLPGTFVYVNAGREISKINDIGSLLNPSLIMAFTLLGILPLISKWIIAYFQFSKFLRRYKKPQIFDYNMVVIGGGSAGLVSAYIGAAVKAKVALIEKHQMGGDCLNTGCVPSKALIRSASVVRTLKNAQEFGASITDVKIHFSKVMERVQSVIKKIEPHDSVKRYTDLGVDCFAGSAKIISPYEVQVGEKILTTKNIVIATGAKPFMPSIDGLESVIPVTSDTVWSLRELPGKMIVLGGGAIGCEMAQAFASLGSHITLIERSDRIMPREDADVSEAVLNAFQSEGVKVLSATQALRVEIINQVKYLICQSGSHQIQIEFDEIFIALGRKANTTGFGLEELGVEISDRGMIVANEYLRTTNYPNIYVCGDVTGPYQFTHTAAHQAWYVAVNALFSPLKKFKVDYRVIPWCTFTAPEVARVGLNEQEAQEKRIQFEVTKYSIDDLDRAITDGQDQGFVKVLTRPGSDKILGATIVGHHAGDIISEFVTAMKFGIGLNKILSTIHIYPTYAEANKFAAGVWKKNHVSNKVLNGLRYYHQWRRR